MSGEVLLVERNLTNSTTVSMLQTSLQYNDWNSTTIPTNVLRFEVYEEYEAIIFAVVLLTFCVFGLFANGLTFAAIWTSPKLHNTVFNIFLMSLCVSDFLSAIDSLGVLYRRTWGFRYWAISNFLCKVTLAVELWTTVATMQHIVAFCILRILSVTIPTKFKQFKPFHAKIIVTILWVETFFVGFIPFYLFPGVKLPPSDISKPFWYSCTMQKQWFPTLKAYTRFGFPILLYIPLVLVVFLCILLIALLVHRRRNSRFSQNTPAAVRRKENFALLQLGLIAFSFLLGYIPDFGYRLYSLQTRTSNGKLSGHSQWFLSLFCHTLVRFSECLNPIFYNVASSQTRQASINFLNGRKQQRATLTTEATVKTGTSTKSGQKRTIALRTTT